MNQGFGLNYNTNFYMVRESGHVPPGMDCLQLQLQPHQLRTQPFHYLINEQAKSLLALQELQNEVGALLEFRDLVMETFPNLRQKMSSSGSNTFSNGQNYCSNLPLPLSGSLNSRHWEPGIKVKRKIVNKTENDTSFVRVRSNSHSSKLPSSQPKSSEAISGVQDSGFSTETNSSNKDHASSTATSVPLPVQPDDPFMTRKENNSHKDSRPSEFDRSDEEFSEDGLVIKVNEAEEELWNLLDVIHTKGTKLREEVETLQLRLMVEEIENQLKDKELEMRKVGKKFNRRCRSLDNMGEESSLLVSNLAEPDAYNPPNFKYHEILYEDDVFNKKRTRSIDFEDIDHIRQERNMLLEKLAEMETENMANRIKTSELQNEISALISTKEELQEQLFQAVKQKTELNGKIHELHMKFVTGDRKWKSGNGSKTDKTIFKELTDSESSPSSKLAESPYKIINGNNKSSTVVEKDSVVLDNSVNSTSNFNQIKKLGTLDGIVSNPREMKKCLKLTDGNKKKFAAILKENNYLELQRHLLVSVVHNQMLSGQVETLVKSQDDLCDQLDKCKKENDELLFQLEEKNIELEGTRARVRVLEKISNQHKYPFEPRTEHSKLGENFTFLENDHLRLKGFSESEINRARQIFLESQNKKVDKLEISKVLNRSKAPSPQRLNELNSSYELEKSGNMIPILALPMPAMASHQSSGTESTQALEISLELDGNVGKMEKCESLKNDKSPYKRRPSKIPLNIQKTSKCLKSVSSDGGSMFLKKSDGELNKLKDSNTSLKKCSLDNSQNSITSRSPSQNPNSIKYNSVGRTSSQLSMASQKSHTSSSKPDKRKTPTQKDENSLTASSNKNINLKQTTNFSNIRQRDTLTRKTQNDNSWDSGSKRTMRSSLRESFRSKISIDGNSVSSKRDNSLSGVKKDSLQLKQTNRTNPNQQKTNPNKSILPTDSGDNTKHEEDLPCQQMLNDANSLQSDENDSLYESTSTPHLSRQSSVKQMDSDMFADSLNNINHGGQKIAWEKVERKPEDERKSTLFEEVRQSFRQRLTEKITQAFTGHKSNTEVGNDRDKNVNVWSRSGPGTEYSGGVDNGEDSGHHQENFTDIVRKTNDFSSDNVKKLREMDFFDSIGNSVDVDKDDSLLINSSYYCNKSFQNEAMAELDSLEINLNKID